MVTRGTAKVRDRDAYLLVCFPDGDLPEQLFFDKETGLLVRKGRPRPRHSVTTEWRPTTTTTGMSPA